MNTHGLEQVKTFEQLLQWAGDHLGWPVEKFEIGAEPFGSLTFEYDAAKDAQGHLEARIAKLETTVGNARIVDESAVDDSTVRILSKVRVMNHKVKKEALYTIVAAAEASFAQGKISVDSPIGRGLLGKTVGDTVEIKVPAGKIKLEVLEISR